MQLARRTAAKRLLLYYRDVFRSLLSQELWGAHLSATAQAKASPKKLSASAHPTGCRIIPMRRPSACHKSVSIVVAVIASAVVYVRTLIHWRLPVIVRRRITVIIVVRGRGRVIRGWIVITTVICGHVRPLCTSAQNSCNDACAKDRQQQCPTATLGFHCRFHQIFPFLEFSLFLSSSRACDSVSPVGPSGTTTVFFS